MKTRSITLGLAIAVLFTACSGVEVVTDQKAGVDFSGYRTYTIVNATSEDEPQSVVNNPINMARFESELHDGLENNGMTVSEAPDVIITYAIAQGARTSYRGTSTDMGGGYYGRWGRGWYGGPGMTSTHVQEYQVPTGTVTVALEDADSGELLWYTTAAGDLNVNQKKVGKGIPKAVEMLLENFPIQEVLTAESEQPV